MAAGIVNQNRYQVESTFGFSCLFEFPFSGWPALCGARSMSDEEGRRGRGEEARDEPARTAPRNGFRDLQQKLITYFRSWHRAKRNARLRR